MSPNPGHGFDDAQEQESVSSIRNAKLTPPFGWNIMNINVEVSASNNIRSGFSDSIGLLIEKTKLRRGRRCTCFATPRFAFSRAERDLVRVAACYDHNYDKL